MIKLELSKILSFYSFLQAKALNKHNTEHMLLLSLPGILQLQKDFKQVLSCLQLLQNSIESDRSECHLAMQKKVAVVVELLGECDLMWDLRQRN